MEIPGCFFMPVTLRRTSSIPEWMKAEKWELSRVPGEAGHILAFQLLLLLCKAGDMALRVKHCARPASSSLFLLPSEAHECCFLNAECFEQGRLESGKKLKTLDQLPSQTRLVWLLVVFAAIYYDSNEKNDNDFFHQASFF